MIVKKPGKYKLLRAFRTRSPMSIATVPKGTIIHVTQIDKQYYKVIAKEFLDWEHWNLPVERIEDDE